MGYSDPCEEPTHKKEMIINKLHVVSYRNVNQGLTVHGLVVLTFGVQDKIPKSDVC